MPEKSYYVSWIDKRTDPWPQWEKFQSQSGEIALGDSSSRILPAEHEEWPGVPVIADTVRVADSKMGQFSWPGIPYTDGGQPCRLYLGPTLSALFHPASRFRNLAGLEGAYLLFQPDSGSPVEMLRKVLHRVGQARGIQRLLDRLQLVPIGGITDPTDHCQIIQAIEKWLTRDPFDLKGRNARNTTTRININLSPGTPAMHASWLMLRWNGSLGKPQCVVEYVQGDGGNQPTDAGERDPLKTVPIDVLSQWIGQQKAPAPPTRDDVMIEKLIGPPFDELRQKIDHAALLGLPILLQGERGTGKTFLARYYHERRQAYRRQRQEKRRDPPAKPSKEGAKKLSERHPEKVSDHQFVTVTLSEYSDLETLRDTLFGWAAGSWTGAAEAYDGLLGEAHAGTLFLDEIHHLDRSLQASLLAPLNSRRYRPKMATYEIITEFDLVVATNDPHWRTKMADDFRDRLERIVLEVPSFRSFQRSGADIIRRFWEFTLERRCAECGLEYNPEGTDWKECQEQLMSVFRRHPLSGNWRDLQRLADNVLLHLTAARDGRPTTVRWDREQLEHAIAATFTDL